MTADIKTLPLPEPLASKLKIMRFRGEIATAKWWEGYLHRHARAVAEHNVAARDAEIEALRAEVEEARGLVTEANNSLYGSQSYFHSLVGGPYNRHHLANGIEDLKRRAREGYAAEVRAERLAEALRDIESRPWNGVRPIQIAARAALRDHDQEGGDA